MPIDRFIAMLDGHMSLVCAAESLNLVFPVFGDSLDIKAARDLIQTFSDKVTTFYPINFNTGQAVVEGSGKTTHLRCLAQLVYLA
jgi:DNA mismatch repair ATPase MutS